MPTITNPQITDSVTQTSVSTIGQNAAVGLGASMEALSQSFALSMQNALTQQQQGVLTHQASTVNNLALLHNNGATLAAMSAGVVNRSTDYSKILEAATMKLLKPAPPPPTPEPPKPKAYPSYPG